jgi:hypothetical protein
MSWISEPQDYPTVFTVEELGLVCISKAVTMQSDERAFVRRKDGSLREVTPLIHFMWRLAGDERWTDICKREPLHLDETEDELLDRARIVTEDVLMR